MTPPPSTPDSPPSAPGDLAPGDTTRGTAALLGAVPARLGRYEVLHRMAVGGMAEIYLARASGPEGFEKVVVVKRIHPRLASSREVVTMFLDEARIAATLRHSNIVQVYDIGEADGEYFFTMELLHGEDSGSLMQALDERGRRLPLEHAVRIVANICAGLHYAHERAGREGAPLGIVHRDVSPSNVFVTMDGEVKLLDFGVAKAVDRLSVTTGGLPKGKLGYMSPEQVQGLPLDRRSDIFSLAVLLWELSTSRRLIRGKGDFETMRAICDEDAPPPSVFQDDYPPDLERIVMKGLLRDRDRRYQTAQEVQLALEEFSREHKLAVSSISLAVLMKELFGVRRTAWLEPSRTAETTGEPPSTPAVATAVTQELPLATRPPPAVGPPLAARFQAEAPTLEIPAVTPRQLATAGRAAVSTQPAATAGRAAVSTQPAATAGRAAISTHPAATATGGLTAPARRVADELPPVAPAASVVAMTVPPAASVAAQTVSPAASHRIARPRGGVGSRVAIVVVAVAVLALVAVALLALRAGLVGTATPPAPPPAPKTIAARAAAARAASKAAAAKAAARTPARTPAKTGVPAPPPHEAGHK